MRGVGAKDSQKVRSLKAGDLAFFHSPTMKRDYIDFQERSEPEAYMITFRCYGTWLHGDKRGSVDRRFHNKYGEPKIPKCPLEKTSQRAAKQPPYSLGQAERRIAREVIREVCDFRGYILHALNVRTNHIHVVVGCADRPEKVMNTFKAYVTRKLRSRKLIGPNRKVWSRHGSTKYLWTEDQADEAVQYVLYGQGDDLP